MYPQLQQTRRDQEAVGQHRPQNGGVEIVICEDNAPKRAEVRAAVEDYRKASPYEVVYVENEVNCGYDRNLRNLINHASGEFILFMGDDDLFVPGALDEYYDFVMKHRNCGYILRSYRNNYADGSHQDFRYYSESKEFEPSDETYMAMFDKSVFISGFTIRREYAKRYETDRFDGSLLYQLYLLAEVCRIWPSAYCHTIITQQVEGGTPYFGASEAEKGLYVSGSNPMSNSLNFMGWYVKLVDYIAEKYNNDTNKKIKHNMSKYSYGFLNAQRNAGIRVFTRYAVELRKMGFASSVYFYIYYLGLLVLGVRGCDRLIAFLKKVIGHRPQL